MEESERRMLQKMKEVKKTVDLNLVNNVKQMDDRLDSFSSLVDNNLITLQKGISDNREVFISVINKVNDEAHGKHELVVEDLQLIVKEMAEVARGLSVVEKKGDDNI